MLWRPKRGMIAPPLVAAAALVVSAASARRNPNIAAAFSSNKVDRARRRSIGYPTGHRRPVAPVVGSPSSWRTRAGSVVVPSSATALRSSAAPMTSSVISPSDDWGNVAVLSLAASLAQLLGRTTAAGRLLGAPVTAMALAFVLSSVGWVPTPASASSTWNWSTVLPPGGSAAATFLQGTSLTLATPLLLLGTSLRGPALRQCGPLLGSFAVASSGTLAGAALAFALGIKRSLVASLPGGDGVKIAAALLAKNIGGGINYMAVCACLNAAPESVAAGLCVDNVMALAYFPLVSLLASNYRDVSGNDKDSADAEDVSNALADDSGNEGGGSPSVEALSHAFTLAAVLTALGRFCNSKLHLLPKLLGRPAATAAGTVNLSLPITTLLAVLFSTYYPPGIFMSPTSASSTDDGGGNDVARAGETLGTSLLYLFFATAGAPGWRLRDSVRRSFPPIASFLVVLYGVHGLVLWGFKKLADVRAKGDAERGGDVDGTFWRDVAAPQRLLAASSAAIGGPATAAALAKSFGWESLLTPSLLVGNVGYAVATFVGLLFYGAFR